MGFSSSKVHPLGFLFTLCHFIEKVSFTVYTFTSRFLRFLRKKNNLSFRAMLFKFFWFKLLEIWKTLEGLGSTIFYFFEPYFRTIFYFSSFFKFQVEKPCSGITIKNAQNLNLSHYFQYIRDRSCKKKLFFLRRNCIFRYVKADISEFVEFFRIIEPTFQYT